MLPAIALPGERQAVNIGPEDLVGRYHRVKRAARAFVGMPHLAPGATRDVGDANRPWSRGLAHRAAGARECGLADERDAAAVDAPGGRNVTVYARVEIQKRLFRHAINADEAVIAAVADERQRCAIRRPAESAWSRFGMHGLGGLGAIEGGHPDLVVPYECQVPVFRD